MANYPESKKKTSSIWYSVTVTVTLMCKIMFLFSKQFCNTEEMAITVTDNLMLPPPCYTMGMVLV